MRKLRSGEPKPCAQSPVDRGLAGLAAEPEPCCVRGPRLSHFSLEWRRLCPGLRLVWVMLVWSTLSSHGGEADVEGQLKPPSRVTEGNSRVSWLLPPCVSVRAKKSERKLWLWGRWALSGPW